MADAGYGSNTEFREGLTTRGLVYAVGIMRDTTVWPRGQAPITPPPSSGRGRPAKRLRRDPAHQPVSVRALARQLDRANWQLVRWREGTKGIMQSRFALTSVRPAHRDHLRVAPRPAELLLIEWPLGERNPHATGFPHCQPELISRSWYAWRKSAGGSNATTKSSKTR